ncbi:MAG: hypothetical protein IKA81_03615 [Alistipes sp.]|nr:hypothetical protein [Alistipes sp.]
MAVIEQITLTLKELGYNPDTNTKKSGVSFNYMLERAFCYYDSTYKTVTLLLPNFYRTVCELEDTIRVVNSHDHIGRIAKLDYNCFTIVTSFRVVSEEYIPEQLTFALYDIQKLYEDFFNVRREHIEERQQIPWCDND